jgi:hypothetical protein
MTSSLNRRWWPNDLELRWVDGKKYVLLKEFTYIRDNGTVVTAPAGFRTDGASIPRSVWPIVFAPMGPAAPAGVLHDYMYMTSKFHREECDELFLEMLLHLRGIPRWKAFTMWKAVVWFADKYYGKVCLTINEEK